MKMSFLPRSFAALLSLGCVGGVVALSTSQQTPVGRVHGRALLDEEGKPLAGVRVVLTSNNDEEAPNGEEPEHGVRRFRAVTNEKGEFDLSRVTVGSYRLSAATHAHETKERTVLVSEDETSEVPLRLHRSQPDLQVRGQQREFLSSEPMLLPVHGYADGDAKSDSLKVRVYRAHLSDVLRDPDAYEALTKVVNRAEPIPALPRALLHPSKGPAPRLIDTHTVSLKNADIEGFFQERLKLGVPGGGLYLIEVAHGKHSVCTQLSVSDLALVVKKSRGQMLAFALDAGSGAPRAGASIRVLQDGQTRASARTDAHGLATIKLPKSDDQHGGELLSLASLGGNEATVGQYDDQGSQGEEGHGDFTVHAYTDRPLYRPGGRVSWKGIARRTLDTGLRYSVPNGQPVDVEVRDPSGERLASSRQSTNAFGSFHGSLELSSEAPSGSYSIVMTIGGEQHTADFSVASYRKPEFAATVTPNEKHYSFGDTVEMMVEGSYYFGAPVAGAKVHYNVTKAPDWSSLYDDEEDASYFQNEGEGEGGYADESGETTIEGDLTLDANGHAIIRFPAGAPKTSSGNSDSESSLDEPQDQIYTAEITVTDTANREVAATGQVPVSSGDFRLSAQTEGYFGVPGQATSVSVSAKDFAGHPIPNAPVELAGTYRKWNPKTEKYQEQPTRSYRATTGANGSARIEFTPPRAGELVLSARTRDSKNRAIAATSTLWIEGGNDDESEGTFGRSLSLLTDKKRYSLGETAHVVLHSESGGTALLTVEGSKLFRSWTVPLQGISTSLEVPMQENYGPNVTLVACTVKDKKFSSSEVPLRVEVPRRTLRVNISSDRASYHPGDRATYQVQTTDAGGKPVAADLSFGVVDEAIYALQEDDPKALQNAFYPRYPNAVQTSYSFEPLYLGDVNKDGMQIEARTKFLDTAFWQSDIQTDRNGRANVSVQLPDNLTTWRTTAIAQSLDSAFGRRTQKIIVAKEFFVRLETPRFFTGGDNSQITALVHNNTGADQDATVKIEAQGLRLSGDETQTLRVPSGAVGKIVWPVATDNAGLGLSNIAHLKLSAWTPGGDKRWSDALESPVPVRPHGREKSDNFVGQLKSDQTWTQKLGADGAAIPSASRVTVRLTPSLSDALVGALPSLIGFPYGCTEQTMSRFLPDILVQRTLRLRGARDAKSEEMRAQLPKMARDSLTRLARFQHYSGGWGWWQNDEDDPWMTAYVLYGLAQARQEGYPVSDEMLSKGRAAALKMLASPAKPLPVWQRANANNTRAFLMYSLALASPTKEETAKIRSLRAATGLETLDAPALSYLVLLDKQIGGPSSAWTQLQGRIRGDDGQMFHWDASGHDEWADFDDKTATALGLRAMLAAQPDDERVPAVLLWLMTHRLDEGWGNTRDTSWVLQALCDYLDANPGAQSSQSGATSHGAVEVMFNGKRVENPSASDEAGGEQVLRIPWEQVRPTGNTLSLHRVGSGEPVFYSVQVRQTVGSDGPLPPFSPTIPIEVTREYRRLLPRAAGTSGWTLASEATNGHLNAGDRIRVRLTFNVPRDLSYVLIEDAFPAGCETSERGTAEAEDDWSNWWSSADVRDDRIAFFARHMSRGKHTIEYNLRAQTPGSYNALPTLLQAMYAPEVRAEAGETRVSID
jgi:uncharacterized protein YfaS (alpha-2-macroglobulin family)